MIRAWWTALAPREQAGLLLAAAVVAGFILYALIWEPLDGGVRTLGLQVEAKRGELAWMRQAAAEAKRLQGTTMQPERPAGVSLLAAVDGALRGSPLREALQRIEPEGDDTVRVWLRKAPFNDLLELLASLERRYGVRPISITMERHEQPGRVDARLVLQGSG